MGCHFVIPTNILKMFLREKKPQGCVLMTRIREAEKSLFSPPCHTNALKLHVYFMGTLCTRIALARRPSLCLHVAQLLLGLILLSLARERREGGRRIDKRCLSLPIATFNSFSDASDRLLSVSVKTRRFASTKITSHIGRVYKV